jgi:hypothetical protein
VTRRRPARHGGDAAVEPPRIVSPGMDASDSWGDDPVTLDALRADDALLDDLADGAPAPDGDALATLLAAWRDVIDEGL